MPYVMATGLYVEEQNKTAPWSLAILPFWYDYATWASLVAQLVKNLPAMWETRVWSLGWKDHMEKEKAAYSSILVWRIPWTV